VIVYLQLVKNGSRTPSQCDSPVSHEAGDQPGSPPLKRFKHLGKVIEQRWKEDLEKTAQLPPGKLKVEQYLSSKVTLSERVDPIDFWVENELSYPVLSAVAVDLLCIPTTCTSAPVKRTISVAGESTTGNGTGYVTKTLRERDCDTKQQALSVS